MGFTYRIATPADRDAYIDFINYVFSHDHQPHDFKALLPKEYGDGRESRAAHFLALDDEGHIRGCVAALPFTVRVLDQDLKYAYIGSVSVHPYARGEGHMKHLMAMVEAWLVEQQVDAAVLGGQRQRYQYFGYSKGGMSVRYDFSFDNARHALRNVSTDGWSVEEITDAQDPRLAEMHALHAAQPAVLRRGVERTGRAGKGDERIAHGERALQPDRLPVRGLLGGDGGHPLPADEHLKTLHAGHDAHQRIRQHGEVYAAREPRRFKRRIQRRAKAKLDGAIGPVVRPDDFGHLAQAVHRRGHARVRQRAL